MEQLRERFDRIMERAGFNRMEPATLLIIAGVCCGLVLWGGCRWSWGTAGSKDSFLLDESASNETSAVAGPVTDGSAADPDGAREDSLLVVHVAGAVLRSGVVTLPPGARVTDAIDAAGGLLSNAAPDALNLARVLADGEQIRVPTVDEIAVAGGAGVDSGVGSAMQGVGAGTSLPGGAAPVDLNRASVVELDSLPGIGPATAQRIVEDREANGPFRTPEDLMRVSGIGPKKFEDLKALVIVR